MSPRRRPLRYILFSIVMVIARQALAQSLSAGGSTPATRGGKLVPKLVFVKTDPSMEMSSSQVIIDADSGSGGVTGAHAAPVFQTTAVANVRRNVIGIMNTDGSNPTILPVHGMDPVISPDGSKIAYCSLLETQYFQIFVMNSDGSEPTRITNVKDGDACGPAWSHDGKRIAFHAFALTNPPRNPRIWVMNADGSGQKKLTDHGLDPAWSPDDRQIAFASNQEGGTFQIYSMSADGTNVKRLTKDKGEASNPAWAPDGQAIAYSGAAEGDRRALFLMAKDGSDPRRLAFSKHQDFCFPAWSPDGKYLAFTSLNRVGPQGIVIGEERPRCEQWTGEYQVYTFDSDGKTQRLTDAKLSAMRASYGRLTGQ
jgi:dipeptidyl aminopeptidase/acylaminoacyl peptidase